MCTPTQSFPQTATLGVIFLIYNYSPYSNPKAQGCVLFLHVYHIIEDPNNRIRNQNLAFFIFFESTSRAQKNVPNHPSARSGKYVVFQKRGS